MRNTGRVSKPPLPVESLPLFPLHAVLLPGAAMSLRVFEPRYLDLVRECGRNGHGFGICLIIDGEEVGAVASAAAYGTEAVVEDFGTGDDGLLVLHVRGGRRFHVHRVRVRDNGLQVADVSWCAADAVEPLQPEHGLLATLLHEVIDKVGGEHAQADESRFDDAAWVGWRLAEMLPLENPQRQVLLQTQDPHERLQQVLALLP
ncbi:LON peptidase substrate-binding domain-containing protein [Lysobacter spongiae]|uniref:LON peptidase substrate-binding domain-containing protein n=1 Tax=Marilutibacter spongiae TaxID=2025720 RepID=A0A7W3Y728_9GAMM|nr:LON peptidase substrate-binding domain-containing protein [Lysobacter spongiae]